MRPWPWAIDADGVGQFFATKAQAVAAVSALQAQGVHSIDVGCYGAFGSTGRIYGLILPGR